MASLKNPIAGENASVCVFQWKPGRMRGKFKIELGKGKHQAINSRFSAYYSVQWLSPDSKPGNMTNEK